MKDRKRTGPRIMRERRDSLGSWCGVEVEGDEGGEWDLAGIVEVCDIRAVTMEGCSSTLSRLN